MLGGLCASVSLVVPPVRQLVCARRATRWAAPRRGRGVSTEGARKAEGGRSSKAKTRQMSSELFSRGWLVVDPRVCAPGAALSP